MSQGDHSILPVFTHAKKSDPILVTLKQLTLTQSIFNQIAKRQRRSVSKSEKHKTKNRNKLRSFFHNGVSAMLAVVASKQNRGD